MRRLYLDTSLLVAALVHEAGTATALRFLQAHAKQPLLISPWVATELASALALQVRRSAITPQESQEAWERFGVLREQRLNTLHLALCQRLNLQLASFDRGLCKAAAHYQVAHEQLLI